jgi:hypothetical protein
MEKKKKTHVSPEAARILEQYRNAGKALPTGPDGNTLAGSDEDAAARPSTPPPSPKMRRSGTRGK